MKKIIGYILMGAAFCGAVTSCFLINMNIDYTCQLGISAAALLAAIIGSKLCN